mgnify:FL=1
MGIIVILYCMTGGMKGAMMTDVIQGSLMIATAVVTFIVSIVMGGGFSNINHTLQSMNEAYLTFRVPMVICLGLIIYPTLYCGPSLLWDSRICLPNSLP